jgi:hypothetical protein
MIGTAAADQINVYKEGTVVSPGTIELVPGGSFSTFDLKCWDFDAAGTPSAPIVHTLTDNVLVMSHGSGTADPSNIVIEYLEIDPTSTTQGSEPYNWNQEDPIGPAEEEILKLYLKAGTSSPPGALYSIQVQDYNGVTQTVQVTIKTTTVPEFPTIALPIAAVLGLMFIISSRKKKE